jgi:hypothetical protein
MKTWYNNNNLIRNNIQLLNIEWYKHSTNRIHCNEINKTNVQVLMFNVIPKIVLLPSCHSYCTWLHCAGFLSPSLLITLNIRTWKLVLFISLQCILLVECLYHSIFNSCILFLIKLLLLYHVFIILLVEETGGFGENHRPLASHWQFYRIMLSISPCSRFELTTSVVIGTDCN